MCFVTVPHPLGMISKEEVNAKVDTAFDDIVKAATAWTPSKEKQDAQVKPYPAKRFKFSGTYADVNDMFQKRKWSLSLPIVPPTVDKVAAMLKGTKRNPAEVLWVVPPRQGMLTVELVAALGVMAGAKPEHMPLLIATVEAMADPVAAWRGPTTTTAATVPVFFISGPIIEKLKLNPGTGTAGGENPVTNALGYFVNLVGDVVGGSVPPNFDKSTQGSSFDLVANVICENAHDKRRSGLLANGLRTFRKQGRSPREEGPGVEGYSAIFAETGFSTCGKGTQNWDCLPGPPETIILMDSRWVKRGIRVLAS